MKIEHSRICTGGFRIFVNFNRMLSQVSFSIREEKMCAIASRIFNFQSGIFSQISLERRREELTTEGQRTNFYRLEIVAAVLVGNVCWN